MYISARSCVKSKLSQYNFFVVFFSRLTLWMGLLFIRMKAKANQIWVFKQEISSRCLMPGWYRTNKFFNEFFSASAFVVGLWTSRQWWAYIIFKGTQIICKVTSSNSVYNFLPNFQSRIFMVARPKHENKASRNVSLRTCGEWIKTR